MSDPERIYEQFKDAELPTWKMNPLDFDLTPPIFPTVESDSALLVPLTETPNLEVPDGTKMVPVRVPEDVPVPMFRSVISAAFQRYLEAGDLNEQEIARLSGHNIALVRRVIHTEEFSYALACRGVDTKGLGTLTPQQDAALMILTDIGSRKSFSSRLKEAGISHAIYLAWMKNPTFARRMKGISEEITANSSIALVELGRKVADGDLHAIRLQLEVSGRHNPAQQAQVDMLVMFNRILEILSANLGQHPEILKAVAKDIGGLAEQVNQQTYRVIEG